jgi:hypothetical protein
VADPILERTAVISEPDFRLVRLVLEGGEWEYVLEVRDGMDAMGVEKWRKFELNGTALRSLFKFLIRIAEAKEA